MNGQKGKGEWRVYKTDWSAVEMALMSKSNDISSDDIDMSWGVVRDG